jgi:hypothetical protein
MEADKQDRQPIALGMAQRRIFSIRIQFMMIPFRFDVK